MSRDVECPECGSESFRLGTDGTLVCESCGYEYDPMADR